MPINKDIPLPSLGVSAAFWRIQEIRDVKQRESGFTGAVGNLFVQMNGYASQAVFAAAGPSLTSETFRIRYGAQIPDPVPERFDGALVIRSDTPSLSDVEDELLQAPHFSGGERTT